LTASGADPTRIVRLKDKTVRELAELKPLVSRDRKSGKTSVHNVVQWLLDYYYENSGTRRPIVGV